MKNIVEITFCDTENVNIPYIDCFISQYVIEAFKTEIIKQSIQDLIVQFEIRFGISPRVMYSHLDIRNMLLKNSVSVNSLTGEQNSFNGRFTIFGCDFIHKEFCYNAHNITYRIIVAEDEVKHFSINKSNYKDTVRTFEI